MTFIGVLHYKCTKAFVSIACVPMVISTQIRICMLLRYTLAHHLQHTLGVE